MPPQLHFGRDPMASVPMGRSVKGHMSLMNEIVQLGQNTLIKIVKFLQCKFFFSILSVSLSFAGFL